MQLLIQKIIFCFFISIVLPLPSSFANDLYLQKSTGEKNFSQLPSKVSPLTNLKAFLEQDLPQGELCPLSFLNQHLSYVRYLYRLIALSFLYEAMEKHSCVTNWNQLLKTSCLAKSPDMKSFLSRAQIFMNEKKDPVHVQGAMATHQCNDYLQLFSDICSEMDSLYGLSNIPFLTDLLQESHALKNLNETGQGASCLKRFVDLFKEKERVVDYLLPLFTEVRDDLAQKKGLAYKEGQLYLSGSLKEFDDKGLSNFIFKETKKKLKVIKAPPVIASKKIISKPVTKETSTTSVAVSSSPLVPSSLPHSAQLPVISAFEKALQYFKDQGEKGVSPINMQDFAQDYAFSPEQVKKLDPIIKEYSQRQALNDMKEFDQLGDKTVPLSLMFVKFLIDQHGHQSLYNICYTLGNKFYIINDLEDKKLSVPIELKFDTNDKKWKIAIVPLDGQNKK